ncbi:hypothetical protein niasHT_008975 [Heterodera trifolii]|uniref:cyclin-dependent kinase n=1 Tax=Heterodera trifolii TaxID=157864 RepID=A0ABD2LW62_9BILA
MSQRLTGDVPYFRTVPSSPSNEDDGLADEDEPVDHQSPTAQQQKAAQNEIRAKKRRFSEFELVEDDEETILRRRLLEKKLEKEKTKAAATVGQQTTKERDGAEQKGAKDGARKEHPQKERPKREKIVWDREKVTAPKSSRHGQIVSAIADTKHGQRSQSQELKPSSSSTTAPAAAAATAHQRRRDESATTASGQQQQQQDRHSHHRRRDEQQQKRGGSATISSTASSRDHPPPQQRHQHKHRHRRPETVSSGSSDDHHQRKDKDRPKGSDVIANVDQQQQRRMDRGAMAGDGEQQRSRTTTTTAEVVEAVPEGDEAAVTVTARRKRRHHQLLEGGEVEAVSAATVEEQQTVELPPPPQPPRTMGPTTTTQMETSGGKQQQEDGEEEEDDEEKEEETDERKGGEDGSDEGNQKKVKREQEEKKKRKRTVEKRKKFSKFESSPEEEDEEDEEEEEEESFMSEEEEEEKEQQRGEKEQKQRTIGGRGGEGGAEQQRGRGGAPGQSPQLKQQHQAALTRMSSDPQELIMEEYFGMDERHFRSRAGTVDTEMNGANTNGEQDDVMDIGDDEMIENKEFEQLTEEEKALLSPEMLGQKEDKYQRRLVSLLPVYYPGISGCRSVAEYECLNKISEGTFGVVYRAQNKRTDEIVALKRLKMEKEHQGFPITSLREINMLLKCGAHPNIVNVREVVVGSSMDKIYLVMDFVEHDVKALIELMKSRNKKWTIPQVKTLLRQLIAGVLYMHDQYVIHRDLKTSNLLLSHQGILKIGDFGLAREFGDPIKPYTPVVVTLWYRAPELLLGTKLYTTPVDMWSVGCIFAEFLKLEPLFPGRTEIDQMQKIFKEVGTPNEQIWPGCMELPGMKTGVFADTPYNQLRKKFAAELPDDDGFDLLNNKWFNNDPKPAHPSTFPTWPAKSEQNRRPIKDIGAGGGRAQQQPPPRPTGGFTLRFDAPKF